MTGRARRGWPRPAGWVAVLAAAVLLAGCGAPEYTYVTNSAERTYLRVPHSWQELDDQAIFSAFELDGSSEEELEGIWFEGYDADPEPSIDHLVGATSPSPSVLVGVRTVPETARGQVSLDLLRDVFRPVSATARAEDAMDPTSPFSAFSLVSDEVLTPGGGLRGVRTVYRYKIEGGPTQVFDQVAYMNDDASKIYMLYARCSTDCYEQRRQEITNVVSSFTVRENPI